MCHNQIRSICLYLRIDLDFRDLVSHSAVALALLFAEFMVPASASHSKFCGCCNYMERYHTPRRSLLRRIRRLLHDTERIRVADNEPTDVITHVSGLD